MAINTQTIRIDLNTGRTIPVAFAHQNDTNRQLTFQLYNNGVAFTPSSTTVKFAYKSPIVNGRYSVITGSQMASGTVSGNTVTVTLPAQYTQVSGVGLLTMILTTSGNTLRPVNIKFVCQGSADGDDTVLGASDWPEGLYDYMDDWLAENEPTEIANLKSDLESVLVSKSLSLTPWEQGYLRNADGTVGSDTARCTSAFFSPTDEVITLTALSGYIIEKVCEYDLTSAFVATYTNLNITGSAQFDTVSGHYYRMQVAKSDGTAFAPSDITESTFTVTYKTTDTTLNESGKVADSKTVGDSLNAFSVRSITQNDLISGYIDFSTGTIDQNTARLGVNRKIYITCDTFIKFEYGDTIDQVYIELYDKNNTIVKHTQYVSLDSIRINKADADYINLIFRNSDSATLTLSDFDASVYLTPSESVRESASAFKMSVFFDSELGSISSTTGEPQSGTANLFRSKDFIDVLGVSSLIFENQTGKEVYVFEYDENKTFIQVNSRAIQQGAEFDIGNNTRYIKFVARILETTEQFDIVASTLLAIGARNSESRTVKIPMEEGSYSSSSQTVYGTGISTNRKYIINSYPIAFSPGNSARLFHKSNYDATIIFRNASGGSVSSSVCPSGGTINAPADTAYIDIEIRTDNILDDDVYLITNAQDNVVFVHNKRIATNNGNRIAVVYRLDKGSDLLTYANLLLPPNYSINKKVPCILWMDGSGNMTSWGSSFSDKLPYLEYLRDEGFAILSIFAWGYNYYTKYPSCGNAYPYPVPTNLAFIKAGLEYICDRYNIDPDNIHIMSKSQGGQCAYYFASHPIWNFKSIGMFAPVLDYLSMPGEPMYADTRKAIAEDLGLTGNVEYFTSVDFSCYSSDALAFWESNLHQIIGFNEAYTELNGATALENVQKSVSDCAEFWTDEAWNTPNRDDIYNHHEYKKFAKVPVKIWGASDDSSTPFPKMSEAVSQLQNGGTEAVLRTFERGTGGHGCADVGSNYVAEVTTALGITHTNVRTGWIENVEWIRLHMAK